MITAHVHRSAALAVLALAALACGGDEDGSIEAGQPATSTATTTSAVPTTTPPTTDAPSSTAAPTTVAPTTTEAGCGRVCPPDPVDVAAAQAMIDAYNAGDWDAFLATVVESPAPAMLGAQQTPDLFHFDFQWSATLNEEWSLGECFERDGTDLVCDVTIEDDVHRALADLGLEPSECRIVVRVDDGLVDLLRYEVSSCHVDYDLAYHAFGLWFFENFPGEGFIDGFHYRGWNQTQPEMAVRAAELIDEYLASGEATIGVDHH